VTWRLLSGAGKDELVSGQVLGDAATMLMAGHLRCHSAKENLVDDCEAACTMEMIIPATSWLLTTNSGGSLVANRALMIRRARHLLFSNFAGQSWRNTTFVLDRVPGPNQKSNTI